VEKGTGTKSKVRVNQGSQREDTLPIKKDKGISIHVKTGGGSYADSRARNKEGQGQTWGTSRQDRGEDPWNDAGMEKKKKKNRHSPSASAQRSRARETLKIGEGGGQV